MPLQLREKYGLTDAMVAMDVVEIIDIPGFGRQAAVKVGVVIWGLGETALALYSSPAQTLPTSFSSSAQVCDDLKIKSQNDKDKLAEAKERVYLAGFYSGVLLVGRHAGKKVCDAKGAVRTEMIAEGLAAPYWEPESLVVSRSGDECVVADGEVGASWGGIGEGALHLLPPPP